jgi:hypothetical protein
LTNQSKVVLIEWRWLVVGKAVEFQSFAFDSIILDKYVMLRDRSIPYVHKTSCNIRSKAFKTRR